MVGATSSSGLRNGAALLCQMQRGAKAAGSRPLIRTLTSSAPAASSSSLKTARPSPKGKAREDAKHDANLRRAISLHHTSAEFFPCSATVNRQKHIRMPAQPSSDGAASSSSKSTTEPSPKKDPFAFAEDGEAQEEAAASAIAQQPEQHLYSLEDELDWHVRTTLHGDARNGGQLMKERVRMFNATSLLNMQQRNQLRELPISLDGFDDDRIRQSDVEYMFSRQTLSSSTDLPPRDDPEAIKAYLANAVRQSSEAKSKSVSASHDYADLDHRTARVRDALFGTIHGDPGLEIVRERAREASVQREAQRLQQEASERQG